MAELAGEQFISYRKGARLRELLEEGARQSGFQPNVKFESNESQRIRALVARGLGVAIIPRSDAVAPGPAIAIASLTEPELNRDITLAWRADRRHSPAATEFLTLVRDLFAGPATATGHKAD
jgi:DNA-binding transcriptional LysR family regulator